MALLPILDVRLPAPEVPLRMAAIRALGVRLEFITDAPGPDALVRLRAQQVNCAHCPDSEGV